MMSVARQVSSSGHDCLYPFQAETFAASLDPIFSHGWIGRTIEKDPCLGVHWTQLHLTEGNKGSSSWGGETFGAWSEGTKVVVS
jgi:hypothetical protein